VGLVVGLVDVGLVVVVGLVLESRSRELVHKDLLK
jgi:hypothetical protein